MVVPGPATVDLANFRATGEAVADAAGQCDRQPPALAGDATGLGQRIGALRRPGGRVEVQDHAALRPGHREFAAVAGDRHRPAVL